MDRTTIGVLTIGVTSLACTGAQAQQKQPNIILIMADQMRGDCLGVVNKQIKTPNLDHMAHNGVLFTNGYASAPSSTPARAGLLTGLSPWNHGMVGFGRVAEHYPYEMPRMLSQAGYYTFGVGKMHWFPQKALHGFNGTLVDESGRYDQVGFVSDYRDWFKRHAPGMNPDSLRISWNSHYAAAYPLPEELHPTAWTAQMAIELINSYGLEAPLFLKVSFARPHSPYDPPQRLVDLYNDADIPLPIRSDWGEAYACHGEEETSDAFYGDFGDQAAIRARKYYYASISFIDEQVGRIIEALKARGLYDNSLIIFVSDHGDMLGDHNHWRKTYPYEGSSKVPFIVQLPRYMQVTMGGQGENRTQPVELRDVLPTMLNAAGAVVPEAMDGRSVLPLIADAHAPWREFIDLEHAQIYTKENSWMALTDGKIKYIWNCYTQTEELFDLMTDPQEQHNMAGVKRYAKTLEAWRARMVAHLAVRGDRYVRDGKLQRIEERIIYSPNYPGPVPEPSSRNQRLRLSDWRREASRWR